MEMLIGDCHIGDLYDKINEIINYINKKENKSLIAYNVSKVQHLHCIL